MTIQIDAKMACVKLTKSFGLDIVVAMRMLSYDALMFPKTAETANRTAGVPLFCCSPSVGGPGFPRRTLHRSLIICRNNSENSKGCLGHHTARCLSASFERHLYTSGQPQSGFIK
jgi:hypothetical protein